MPNTSDNAEQLAPGASTILNECPPGHVTGIYYVVVEGVPENTGTYKFLSMFRQMRCEVEGGAVASGGLSGWLKLIGLVNYQRAVYCVEQYQEKGLFIRITVHNADGPISAEVLANSPLPNHEFYSGKVWHTWGTSGSGSGSISHRPQGIAHEASAEDRIETQPRQFKVTGINRNTKPATSRNWLRRQINDPSNIEDIHVMEGDDGNATGMAVVVMYTVESTNKAMEIISKCVDKAGWPLRVELTKEGVTRELEQTKVDYKPAIAWGSNVPRDKRRR